MKKFNPSSNHPDRALQAWQILVAAAMNRQTFTYKGLSQLMYQKDAAGVLDKILGHIAFFCSDNKLPALTSIVVGKARGTPGADIPVAPKVMDREREKVYNYDWYNVYPPLPKQLADSFASNG
ncbi:hypothetical protein [Luteimonas sp. MC1572]|uniref:hypothetical protein n=1 Tax=Luteimonas sp. MC1572 TaxID=2799325 RepID=UPI0018F0EC4A|nr:hypothetical protein [Luteimonas sp. MC1572]MBJ6981955.1 hypothetical protein [Luteimonas sp. MC1572]QQO03230.1 hypothetical protein JGR64_00140 [Luteimonas sp. MC1572]